MYRCSECNYCNAALYVDRLAACGSARYMAKLAPCHQPDVCFPRLGQTRIASREEEPLQLVSGDTTPEAQCCPEAHTPAIPQVPHAFHGHERNTSNAADA